MHRPHTWVLPLALLAIGCDGLDNALCNTSAAYSVTVSVFDMFGEPYAPEEVRYSVDGGPESLCEPISKHTEFLCGLEEVGRFKISVYDNGVLSAEETVDVDVDHTGCHVDSQFIDVVI